MQIGQVIRRYRKEKALTQEEMANRLGVTAPAVNKWESGASMPDIMLLAPIARLLGISLDTLLCFQERPADDEIRATLCELESVLTERSYEAAWTYAEKKAAQYPDCAELMLGMALTLNGWQIMKRIAREERYDALLAGWYERVLQGGSEALRQKAADALFGFYFVREQYGRAEEYLAYFSEQNPDKKLKQAIIYSETNRRTEAYRAYEELLYAQYQTTSALLHHISRLAAQDGNLEKVQALGQKQRGLAQIFEMGEYYEAIWMLEAAVERKDAEAAIEFAGKALAGIEKAGDAAKSTLYEHMAFQGIREVFLAQLKNNLRDNLRDEESFGFVKGDKRWMELVRSAFDGNE